MTEVKVYPVKPAPQYLLRLKWDVIRAHGYWQQAETESEEEKRCEDRLRRAVEKLLQWCPEYREYTMVSELIFWLNQELKKK